MKKSYLMPCVHSTQAEVRQGLLTASGNLTDMTNGDDDIFGSDDESKKRKSDGDDFGSLW